MRLTHRSVANYLACGCLLLGASCALLLSACGNPTDSQPNENGSSNSSDPGNNTGDPPGMSDPGTDGVTTPVWQRAFDTSQVGALSAVWGSSPNDVFVVGGGPTQGEIYHFDGAVWRAMAVPQVPLLVWVYGFAPNDVTAVGLEGSVVHYDGNSWKKLNSGTTQDLWGIWGAAPNDMWIVGVGEEEPLLLHFDGTIFTPVSAPANDRGAISLFKVWGIGSKVFAVGQFGLIIQYDGGEWFQVPTGPNADEDFVSLWGTSEDNIVAVGGRSSARIATYNGSDWTTNKPTGIPGLNAVNMSEPDRAVVGGANGYVGNYEPAANLLTTESAPVAVDVHGIWTDGEGRYYGVGGDFRTFTSGVVLVRSSDGVVINPVPPLGMTPSCSADTDCASGEVCAGGACVEDKPDEDAHQSGASLEEIRRASWLVIARSDASLFSATSFGVSAMHLATSAGVVEEIKRIAAETGGGAWVFQHESGALRNVSTVWTHPDYDPEQAADTPDLGLLETDEAISSYLEVPASEVLQTLGVLDQVALCGFPSNATAGIDFADLIANGGVFHPRVTCAIGLISLLRPLDANSASTPENSLVIEHDMETAASASGSALFDAHGEAIGVHLAGLAAGGTTDYAIRADKLAELLALVEQDQAEGTVLADIPQSNPLPAECAGADLTKDQDGDGIPDDCDVCRGDDKADADGDGVPDACDDCPGFDDNADADDDGVPDGCDLCDDGGSGACDDGLFCNGAETCNPLDGECLPGNGAICDDGVDCTVDSCNESTDSCDHVPDDGLCDNGLFCDGPEFCDLVAGCLDDVDLDCDDGINCTDDSCDEVNDVCVNEANDAFCDDALLCNGEESCDALLDCQQGTPLPDCCTIDADCDDNNICNGVETCTVANGTCEFGTPLTCDNGVFCDGVEICNPTAGCLDGPDPVCNDGVFCTTDSCNISTDVCQHVVDDGLCNNGGFCDGVESCDAINGCQDGPNPDCDDGVACTFDSCNEGTDECDHDPNDSACNDLQFCNGVETCDSSAGCQSGGDPCTNPSFPNCNEELDTCEADDPCPLDDPDDSDGDGVCDSDDICPGFDDNVDTDGNGVPDGCCNVETDCDLGDDCFGGFCEAAGAPDLEIGLGGGNPLFSCLNDGPYFKLAEGGVLFLCQGPQLAIESWFSFKVTGFAPNAGVDVSYSLTMADQDCETSVDCLPFFVCLEDLCSPSGDVAVVGVWHLTDAGNGVNHLFDFGDIYMTNALNLHQKAVILSVTLTDSTTPSISASLELNLTTHVCLNNTACPPK